MSQLPAIAGVGGSFELGGKTWTWSPLTIGQMAAFEAEIRELLADRLDVIGSTKRACDENKLGTEDRRVVLEAATKEHMELQRAGAFDLIDRFNLPDASAALFRHCLLPHHPELTIDDTKQMIATQVVGRVFHMMVEQARSALPGKDRSRSSGDDSTSQTETPAAVSTRKSKRGSREKRRRRSRTIGG